jgi:hypothetical protein
MTDGTDGGAAVAPPCPLCAGTGRRRIHHPGTPRGSSVLVDCRCVAHQARRDAAANNIHPHTPRNNKPVTRPKD